MYPWNPGLCAYYLLPHNSAGQYTAGPETGSTNLTFLLFKSSNNTVSQSKRAVSTAITVMFGGLGGIIASLVFRQADSPRYRPGIYATIASQFLMLALLGVTTAYYRRKNRNIREGTAGEVLEGRAGFLYTL